MSSPTGGFVDNFQISIELFPYNYLNLRFMIREDRLLRALMPSKDVFTREDYEYARSLLARADGKSGKASSLPSQFVRLGGTVRYKGRDYRCVLRDDVTWSECCRGCAFAGADCPPALQCSSFDRRDGLNVWFQEECL